MALDMISLPIAIAALSTSLLIIIQVWLTQAKRQAALDRLPFIDATKEDALVATHRGYVDYLKNGLPYRLRTEHNSLYGTIMLPHKYLQEIKDAPVDLSFYFASDMEEMAKYTGTPVQTPALTHTAKHSLNRNLSRLLPLIQEGLTTDLANTFPKAEKSVAVLPTFLNVVGRNAARVLATPELSDNEEWVRTSIQFTENAFAAAHSVKQNFGRATMWLARWIDGPTQTVWKCRRRAAQMLRPHYLEHRRSNKESTGIDWLLDAPQRKQPSLQEVTDDILLLSLAAIHTTTLTLITTIRDLATHPEVRQSLREEIAQLYTGEWTAAALAQLRLLDSFMAESQRCHYIALNIIARAPRKDYTFKDGLVIPAGTLCLMAAHELSMDPDVFPDPQKFDPLRFFNLNQSTGTNNYSFTSIATDRSLNFGAGSNTCPGRHFATATMKIILSELLMNYDFHWPEDKVPSTITAGTNRMVDPTAMLIIRRRED